MTLEYTVPHLTVRYSLTSFVQFGLKPRVNSHVTTDNGHTVQLLDTFGHSAAGRCLALLMPICSGVQSCSGRPPTAVTMEYSLDGLGHSVQFLLILA